MQPNKAATPWGVVSSVTTLVMVLSVIYLGFTALSTIPGTGIGLGDHLEDSLCSTSTRDTSDERIFTSEGSNGMQVATAGQIACKPFDEFAHPAGARAMNAAASLPLALAVLGLALGLRRVIDSTRDDGPFSQGAVEHLRRLRWWATAFMAAAVVATSVVSAWTGRVVTGHGWHMPSLFWPVVVTYIASTSAVLLCEFGAQQRQAAYDRGAAERSPAAE